MTMVAPVRIAYLPYGAKKPAYKEQRTVWNQDGLAVTEAGRGSGWAVTHVASGYAAFHGVFRLRRDAIAAAKLLLPLGDWTLNRSSLPKSMKDGTLAILADLRGREVIS